MMKKGDTVYIYTPEGYNLAATDYVGKIMYDIDRDGTIHDGPQDAKVYVLKVKIEDDLDFDGKRIELMVGSGRNSDSIFYGNDKIISNFTRREGRALIQDFGSVRDIKFDNINIEIPCFRLISSVNKIEINNSKIYCIIESNVNNVKYIKVRETSCSHYWFGFGSFSNNIEYIDIVNRKTFSSGELEEDNSSSHGLRSFKNIRFDVIVGEDNANSGAIFPEMANRVEGINIDNILVNVFYDGIDPPRSNRIAFVEFHPWTNKKIPIKSNNSVIFAMANNTSKKGIADILGDVFYCDTEGSINTKANFLSLDKGINRQFSKDIEELRDETIPISYNKAINDYSFNSTEWVEDVDGSITLKAFVKQSFIMYMNQNGELKKVKEFYMNYHGELKEVKEFKMNKNGSI